MGRASCFKPVVSDDADIGEEADYIQTNANKNPAQSVPTTDADESDDTRYVSREEQRQREDEASPESRLQKIQHGNQQNCRQHADDDEFIPVVLSSHRFSP